MGKRYGIIDESYFTLRSPRMVDDDYSDLSDALAGACENILDGVADSYSIVRCKLNATKDGYIEDTKYGSINVNVNWDWWKGEED